MMGRTHALTGLAAGTFATYSIHVPLWEGVAGVALCAGAAILPDIDHPRSTVSNVYGPLTRAFCWLMTRATGGHRRGTHSVPGILFLGAVAHSGVMYRDRWYGMLALCTIMILCFAGAIRLLRIPGWFDDFLPIPLVIGVVCLTDIRLDMVPYAVVLGCLVHVAGDVATKQGCPLWWPLSDRKTRLALFKTNGITEKYVVTPLVIVVIIGQLAHMFYRGVDALR